MEQRSPITSSLVAVSVVFPVLATVATALRYFTRRIKSQNQSIDDWVNLAALVSSWAISINNFVAGGMGGINETSLSPPTAEKLFNRARLISTIPIDLCLGLTKISILLFYARIFVTRTFRTRVYVFTAVLVSWTIAILICDLVASYPVSAQWHPTGAIVWRYDKFQFTLVKSCMSLVFDVMVLCFPLPIIKNLHMKAKRKIMVAGILWLGSFCCIAAAVRVWAFWINTKNPGTTSVTNSSMGPIWACIEPNCAIIAACLPTYGPLFTNDRSPLSVIRSLIYRRENDSEALVIVPAGNDNHHKGQEIELGSMDKHSWEQFDHTRHTVEITNDDQEDGQKSETQNVSPRDIAVSSSFTAKVEQV